ncbi:ANKYRIN REPEAT DOMAIN-CONTAINING PROTEIN CHLOROPLASTIC [Salix koriyanagi]|uniref:ANKYRIN REPEAT DOMAIN-CONTAINING PROTEIN CHLOROPLASTIC n=1 Tax=Salix koriyanagi TaxID=2511006 RepID=A0A9Q0P620_9ROSI|nr:ANKYRIN REPEAT DOMAIN-CONTAINING PROTEIN CHLOROPLASTIC [Salix koriyanagi]
MRKQRLILAKRKGERLLKKWNLIKNLKGKRKGWFPIRSVNLEDYQAFREAKLAQLKPLVLGNPESLKEEEKMKEEEVEVKEIVSERVKGKHPRWAVYGRGLDDVREFLNSEDYEPGELKPEGKRKLFTKEEKVLLNKRVPDLAVATSSKWLPLHTLAASGEFHLMDALLKHNVDINAVDVNGWTALHRAILCKKQAITSYLLRESADPFVRDAEGATLMHYAVQTASAPAIKLLLLYNVDINLQDNDGWTPLHLAVQTQRTDIVKLLLIKRADRMLKNKDGLTPLDLCLCSGRDTRTYELIKLLKQFAKKPTSAPNPYNASASQLH